ncbi:hypothetical protein CHLNCDRAFT_141617 [Chlorella variabilis]|uniref:F-box domain-containing protein n=1 Tax=Chlorella variabilis TaxID=554065 RepID=E1ZT63_CHLVA|nr:hypothetical protein CHLNCDRAFT_141617 [Chlorella variabilis]EFN50974.1 hypothetical protein CHLNCDRAFT_141617 [Chlorella variabilis]|eukprot:XP_005843076.1 hypothetical protein CHLNCDRAFT_141617 [Chlorella variabilis]
MQTKKAAARAREVPSSISDLPIEVLQHVFSFLSEEEDRLLDVCAAWHAAIEAGGPAL